MFALIKSISKNKIEVLGNKLSHFPELKECCCSLLLSSTTISADSGFDN
jgi:hypothetical protein